MTFDRRITPARGDIAARHLEGKVLADRFVDGEHRVVLTPQAPLRRAPAHDASLETEALLGENVTVYETIPAGWCWCQLDADGYVGWLPADALAAPGPPPTHRVSALRTLAFPIASIKAPPKEALPFGAQVTVVRTEGPLAVISTGDHIPARHLAPLGSKEEDFVAVAERFVGTPYLWGGKTSLGIDCSGLVQVALTACGLTCPRDSDMQQQALGRQVEPAQADFRRGDLVFWKGHVGIVRDPATLLHANAFHMSVVLEPLREAIERIAAAEAPPVAIKRL